MCGSFASIVYSITRTTNDSVWIKQIVKYQCTDDYLQNIFLYYELMIDGIANTLTTATFLWGVLFAIHIIFFIARMYIGDLYSKREPVQEAESIEQQQMPLDVL